jgi:endonuclease-8
VPEGDSLVHAADELRPRLQGRAVVRLHGSHRALHPNARRITGRVISDVRTVGKHMLIDFDNGWTLRTHLGMTGGWQHYQPGEPWRRSPGKARVVIETADCVAVCFAAPTVELAPTERIGVRHLGPDLMADEVDWDGIVRRARQSPGRTAADLLLDQRVMAGVGNVYKSETLFLEGIDPQRPVATLTDDDVGRIAGRARKLLMANREPAMRSTTRSTTGSRRPGANYWVYRRAGRSCRRCGATVLTDTHGELDRSTYWCPSCQAPPRS